MWVEEGQDQDLEEEEMTGEIVKEEEIEMREWKGGETIAEEEIEVVEGQLEGQTLDQFPKAVQRMWEKIEEEPQGLTLEEDEQQAQAEVMIGETDQ